MRSVAVFALMVLATPAAAEVFECNGTWTTKPCEGSPTRTVASPSSAREVDDPDRGQKSSMFHDLTMKSIRARESYGFKVELLVAEKNCIRERGPLEQCAEAIRFVEEELDRKIQAAELLKTQQQAVKVQEEANKLQAERNEIERSKPTVAVVRRPVIIVRPDGDHHQHGGFVGSSVQVSGSSPNGNVSISITENSGASYPGRPPRPSPGGHGASGPHAQWNQPKAAGGQVVPLPRKPRIKPNTGPKSLSEEQVR